MSEPLEATVPADWREKLLVLLSSEGITQPPYVPRRKLILGDLGMIFAWLSLILVYAIPIIFLLPVLQHLPFTHDTNDLIGGLFLFFGTPLLFIFVVAPRAQRYGRRLGADFWLGRNASHAVQVAKRPPVLYLRSFALDQPSSRPPEWFQLAINFLGGWTLATPETMLALNAARYAPVLGIGRPDERDPPPGALRIYLAQEQWEAKVGALIPLCQLIIWATGYTEGLHWEIQRLVKTVPPGRLLIWFHVGVGTGKRKLREQEWAKFLATYNHVFPKPLPPKLGRMRYMAFADDWSPISIPGPHEPSTLAALQSFFKARLR